MTKVDRKMSEILSTYEYAKYLQESKQIIWSNLRYITIENNKI